MELFVLLTESLPDEFQMLQLAFKNTNKTIKGTRNTRTPMIGFYDYNGKQEILS